MDGDSRNAVSDWLDDNWDTIHCLSMGVADLAFAAARAMASYGDGSGYWLKAAWDGANAVANLIGCSVPSYQELEDYVGVTTLQCQCSELPGELTLQYVGSDGNLKKEAMSEPTQAKQILERNFINGIATCRYEDGEGISYNVESPIGAVTSVKWYIQPPPGSTCCGGEEPPTPNYEIPKPIPINIPNTTRKYEAVLCDATIDKFGHLQNFYRVIQYYEDGSFADDDFYWESIDGPIHYRAHTRTFEGFAARPPYGPPHRDRVIPITTNGGGGTPISGLNPVSYRLDAGCTWDEEKEEYKTTTFYEIEETPDGILGLARRMDELAKMINDSGLIKYTTCGRKTCLKGDRVTIAWISDEASSDSPLRLRKRTGYRSQSERDSKQLQEYFLDFSWEAGPVCVGHTGAWWGDPQVWASSEAEGKRVLRHIAGEAGIDPDQVGRWTVGGSDNTRLGMTGTMRVRRIEGIPWVSRRQGSNMLPM